MPKQVSGLQVTHHLHLTWLQTRGSSDLLPHGFDDLLEELPELRETFKFTSPWKAMIKNKAFPGGSAVKNQVASTGDVGSIPRLGRSPGEGNGNPLQYYCLENPRDGGAWWVTVHGVAELDTTEWLNSNKR